MSDQLNGGWTVDPERNQAGRDLGYTRYDKRAEALGCSPKSVQEPEDIRPALQRAWRKVEEGVVGFNVTDYRARATIVRFLHPRNLSHRPPRRKGRLRAPLFV